MTATERRKQRRRDASSASHHAHRTPELKLKTILSFCRGREDKETRLSCLQIQLDISW